MRNDGFTGLYENIHYPFSGFLKQHKYYLYRRSCKDS